MDSDNESYSERKAVIVLALEYAPAAFECFFTLRFYAISKSFALNFGSFIERKKKEKRYLPALAGPYREKLCRWP